MIRDFFWVFVLVLILGRTETVILFLPLHILEAVCSSYRRRCRLVSADILRRFAHHNNGLCHITITTTPTKEISQVRYHGNHFVVIRSSVESGAVCDYQVILNSVRYLASAVIGPNACTSTQSVPTYHERTCSWGPNCLAAAEFLKCASCGVRVDRDHTHSMFQPVLPNVLYLLWASRVFDIQSVVVS